MIQTHKKGKVGQKVIQNEKGRNGETKEDSKKKQKLR